MLKTPKYMNELKFHEAQAALKSGEAFQHLAKKFIPKISLIKEIPSPSMSNKVGNLVACATNLAFAIELYLKSLLIIFDLKVPQTHKLDRLYKLVPPAVRTLIEEVYNIELPAQLYQLKGRASITLAHAHWTKCDPQNQLLWGWRDYEKLSFALPDLLARSKDLFQSWRYVFEFHPLNDSSYQVHQFEYGPLWCAAEAIRVEVMVRLSENNLSNLNKKTTARV